MTPESAHDLSQANPQQLARMLSLDLDTAPPWQANELSAVFAHQMSAPIDFEIPAPADANAQTSGKRLSFRELFSQAAPSVALLKLTKEFAKAHMNHPASPIPREISSVLYYASIIVALDRCGERITVLDDPALRRGIAWVLARPWIDEETRALFVAAASRIR